jgi:hypothetical protein
MTTISAFEGIVRTAKQTGEYMPAWESFVNTEFFVGVLPHDAGNQTSDFRFVVREGPRGEPMVIVSEDLSRLESPATDKAIKVRGGNLVSMLNPEVGILVALSDGGFGMPVDLVAWLRACMQVA